MKRLLGIVGSSRGSGISGSYKLTELVLESSGMEYDIVEVGKMDISGCIACLGCASDNICKVSDDFSPELREMIVQADGYVISSPNIYNTINAKLHCFLERFFQFRHQEGDELWGKSAVAIGVGGTTGDIASDVIENFLGYNFIETVAKVSGQGAASCYSCGYGRTCRVGIPLLLHGEDLDIEDIPDVMKQKEVVEAAIEAGKILGNRLTDENHSREDISINMQIAMMEMMDEGA